MRWLPFVLGVAVAIMAAPATAQEFVSAATPGAPTGHFESQGSTSDLRPVLSTSTVTATPEMWFYEQYLRQYTDPQLALARAAQARAQQRWLRLESQRWYGYSKSRPIASPDPYNSPYSPGWGSGNPWNSYQWNSRGSTVVTRPSVSMPLY